MKKVLMFVLFLQGMVFADGYGAITKVDNASKTIVVNQSTIKVMPYTKIEEESCQGDWDMPKTFADLRQGQFVEIDILGMENNMLIAKDIEIKCANRAY